MQTEIQITIKSVYGETKAYPANDQARRLAGMVGTKTLTPSILEQARTMGFRIVEVDRFGQAVGEVRVAA